MCGVCAGNPADTALGDVVVGEPVYEWDEGKQSPSGFEGDHRQFRLEPLSLRTAQEFNASSLASYGDASEDEALLWFLEQLLRGQQPRNHPALSRYFPSGTWQPRLARLEEQGLIRRELTGEAVLTSDGSDLVQRRLYDDVDGPQRLPFRVLTAPMASGSAVIADPDVWSRLKAMGMRKITAVEMEAATIERQVGERGTVAADDRDLLWREEFAQHRREHSVRRRGQLRRFEHDSVAGGDRGDDGHQRQVDGVVRRRNDPDHSERLVFDAVGAETQRQGDVAVGRAHEPAEVVDEVVDALNHAEDLHHRGLVSRPMSEVGVDRLFDGAWRSAPP
jgi:nucleoside phosphorylase